MIRKFLSVFIALFVLFVTQSQVFAATAQIDESQKTMAQYNYTINTQTVLNEEAQAPYQLAARRGGGDMNEYIWIASIFIAGLGQILMGDVEGGIWWMIKVYALPIIFGILMTVLTVVFVSAANAGNAGLIATIGLVGSIGYAVVAIISLIFYIMNIIDAYNMAQGKVSALEMERKMAELQNIAKIAENISVRDGNISYKVLAF